MRELYTLEMPNFRLRERETSAGEVSFDLQRKDSEGKWQHVSPGDMIAMWAFIRELGMMLRGGLKR